MTVSKEPPWEALRRPETSHAEHLAAEDALARGDLLLADALYATAAWQRDGGQKAWDLALERTAAYQREVGIEVPAASENEEGIVFGPLTTVEPACSAAAPPTPELKLIAHEDKMRRSERDFGGRRF